VGTGTGRSLPAVPATRVRYPNTVLELKSPSGNLPVDTNQYYKHRLKTLPSVEVKDFRYDPMDDSLIINKSKEAGETPIVRQIDTSVDKSFCESFKGNSKAVFRNVKGNSPERGESIELQHLQSPADERAYRDKYNERIRVLGGLKCNTTILHPLTTTDSKSIVVPSDKRRSVVFCEQEPSNEQSTCVSPKGVFMSAVSIKTGALAHTESHLLSVDRRITNLVTIDKQRSLHNQSSTETSGLGETITSAFSSQESFASCLELANACGTGTGPGDDQGIDLREDTVNKPLEGNYTFGTNTIDSDNRINHTHIVKDGANLARTNVASNAKDVVVNTAFTDTSNADRLGKTSCQFSKASATKIDDPMKDIPQIKIPTDTFKVGAYRPPIDYRADDAKKPDSLKVHSSNLGPDFDDLFKQSKKTKQITVGLRLDQINNEWNRQQRGSSTRSRSSHGSFRSRSGSVRRSNKLSKWMTWGAQRRASYRRRQENLEKPPEQPRASTPVKKARQEGLMFIHPDLESKYISEDDINYIKRHRHERLKAYKLIEKAKVNKYHDLHEINPLTAGELVALSRFWEHKVFIRSRYISILLSLVTTIFYILCICSTEWVSYPSPESKYKLSHTA